MHVSRVLEVWQSVERWEERCEVSRPSLLLLLILSLVTLITPWRDLLLLQCLAEMPHTPPSAALTFQGTNFAPLALALTAAVC